MKVGIVDDEVLARNLIEDYCSKINNIEIVINTGNPLEFINYIQDNEIDLLFLDIEMPELNGMEILRSMINPPKVILTTAYSDYALESYNYDVVDYLLKPIKLARFLKAINKVSSSLSTKSSINKSIKDLQIKHDGMPISIPLDTILYIQSFGNYLKIFTNTRMYLITETLTNITNDLSDDFQRTHKSYIANMKRVTKATNTHLIISEKEVPVSASYKMIVRDKLRGL